MKKIFILSIIIINYLIANSQNVGIGTTTPASKLHIKGSADISQLIIDANATQSNTNPLIRLRNSSGGDLLHIHSDNSSNIFIGVNAGRVNNAAGSGTYNTFMGSLAGYTNNTGSENVSNGYASLYLNTTGFRNTAIGMQTLYSNTTGALNSAIGANSLYSNTTAYYNTAVGSYALYSNTTGTGNTASGTNALKFNNTGFSNTAIGYDALFLNSTGGNNIANGYNALYNNTAGNNNVGIGNAALFSTTSSEYNTAVGFAAGYTYDNGYNNVFLGANVDVAGPGYYNVIAIGQGTICTASSQVTMGNGATNSYRAYANWSNISDGRFKKNVQENVPGLDFITKLHPVTYNLNATDLDAFLHKNNNMTTQQNNKEQNNQSDAAKAAYNKALQEKENTTYTGFVAQDVEATAKQLRFNFSGIDAPKDANDVYGLRYAEFVVPLVKAVQEQQQMIEELKKENETQKSFNSDLQKQIDELKTLIKK